MLQDTVKKIEEAIGRINSVQGGQKQELLGLLSVLKSEVGRLAQTHEEHAHSIAGFAELAAREATRRQKSPGLLDHSLKGLALSAAEFEGSHPRLVDTINEICAMLARLGI
ncbi:MAG: DUF4404 family protein [Elusimicrobiota bacterium]|jgi:hypothetical protein